MKQTDGDSVAPIFSASAGHLSSYDGIPGPKGNGVYVYPISHMGLIQFTNNPLLAISVKNNISLVIN